MWSFLGSLYWHPSLLACIEFKFGQIWYNKQCCNVVPYTKIVSRCFTPLKHNTWKLLMSEKPATTLKTALKSREPRCGPWTIFTPHVRTAMRAANFFSPHHVGAALDFYLWSGAVRPALYLGTYSYFWFQVWIVYLFIQLYVEIWRYQ